MDWKSGYWKDVTFSSTQPKSSKIEVAFFNTIQFNSIEQLYFE